MTRQYLTYLLHLTYLLPAICLLSACQSDYDEPGLPEAAVGEALEIMVAETVNTVSGDGASRSSEAGASTLFDKGDRIGIIILGEDGKILADNVPYVYDGVKWDFDADNTEGKQLIYYDATMYKYIVYYPYTAQADLKTEGNDEGTMKKIKWLMTDTINGYFKALPLFKWREVQSNEEDFRYCDPMVWSKTGFTTSRSIRVELGHIRNCFVLDPKVQWTLANGETISYQPRNYEIDFIYDKELISATEFTASDTGFDDLFIYLGDYQHPKHLKYFDGVESSRKDILFHAQDGSFRYILGDEPEYTFNWEYSYRDGKTYGGVQTIRQDDTRNTRFIHDETINMGYLMDDKVRVGDFYCCKDGVGYPLPYDAVDLLDPQTCVGVVFYVGHYPRDLSYEKTPIGSAKCHGYVMALTEANEGTLRWCVQSGRFPLVHNIHITGDDGYEGYWNRESVIDYLPKFESQEPVTIQNSFPAFNACEIYGTTSWHEALTPPVANTTGWYLPTKIQCEDIRNAIFNVTAQIRTSLTFKDNGHLMKTLATVRRKLQDLPQDCAYLNYILPQDNLGWWTSSQANNASNVFFVSVSAGSSQQATGVAGTEYHHVRAVLSY